MFKTTPFAFFSLDSKLKLVIEQTFIIKLPIEQVIHQ